MLNIFHSTCLLCQEISSGGQLCTHCTADLPWIDSACSGCGLPLPSGAAQLQCGECLADPSPFNRVIIPFRYQSPLNSLISQFKHQEQLASGRLLGDLLGQQLTEHYLDKPLPEAIIPVPLHWKRLLSRGFNQSAELGNQLSKALNIPCQNRALTRVRPTPSQQGLGRQARLKNLSGAFTLRKPLPYSRVALLDDVVTTGATATEIGKLLLRSGVREVHLWAIARTPVS